ncbi:Disease resistance protein rga2 [Thalictrum thalictroides]|uniref:Disease resistance protein rga2 n=1 Tax=Thalictrum thalictroides TaxID=46969 RepID=A0A7J6VKT5_THATH|nr:Disease resistance protein rga2 [Thalictrum thalictroides]
MTNVNPADFYPEGKVYDYLTKLEEDLNWYDNLNWSIEALNEKLSSPRLKKLDTLWYSGFEDGELKKMERTLLTIRIVVDDIYREKKELRMWRIQHRHLKDLLCEFDDILDDIAVRAPLLKQLFQSQQVSENPYLNDKLVQMNNLIQELDTTAIEIKSEVLPEFNTRRRNPPGPKVHSSQSIGMNSNAPSVGTRKLLPRGKTDDQAEIPIVDHDMQPMLYKIFIRDRLSDQPVKYPVEFNVLSDDFSKTSKEGFRRKQKGTQSLYEPDNSTIYDEESLSTPSKGVSTSKIARIDIGSKEERKPINLELSPKITNIDSLPQHLKKCLLYTSLFPRNYEFEKDMLVQMWIAVGYIREGNKLLEQTAGAYFDELLSRSIFLASPVDESRYILEENVYELVHDYAASEYAKLEDGNINNISNTTLHSSVLFESTVDPMTFKSFHKLRGLHSLLLLHDSRKYVKGIPYDLIASLRCVRVLDLSRTQITELPNSVGDLKALHYFDLSGTLIKSLPQSICSLSSLLVLKLRDCLNLFELPKNMKNMVNLRHLDLDIIRQLKVMPPRLGRLINLQTLSAFIAGKGRGYQIAELKNMNNLQGSLRIFKLENVLTVEDAEEAAMFDKEYLSGLELQWSLACDEAVEVLEGLQPHRNLKKLVIISYGGLTFPTWLGDSTFSNLTNVFIYNCQNCILLPLLGRLPSLTSLRIGEMHALTKVDHTFFGGNNTNGFPKLETLDLDGMPSLEEWTGMEENVMPHLRKVTVVDCPNLAKISELSNLKSLQRIEFSLCFKLPSLAEKKLPPSLQTLIITDCPKLKEGCQEKGVEWHKIVHVPAIWIDYQWISKQKQRNSRLLESVGSLSLVKLENVLTGEDAEEAAIYSKEYLRKLHMQWSVAGLEPMFSKLTSVYIYNCKNCTLLPLLGRLPSLKLLLIGEMHALTKVDHQFFGGKNTKMFSKLETLAFDGMPCLEEWTRMAEKGMPCLRKLTIVDCPNLVKLSELSNLKTLQHLEISLCFKLQSLAEKMLPASLETLIITDCPKLKEGCQEKGVHRHKIVEVPAIWIDYQQIFLQEAPVEYDP